MDVGRGSSSRKALRWEYLRAGCDTSREAGLAAAKCTWVGKKLRRSENGAHPVGVLLFTLMKWEMTSLPGLSV